VSRSRSSFFSR